MSSVVDYDIVKKINAGGMADIYLGIMHSDTGFEKLCAVKTLLPEYAGHWQAEELFKKEGELGRSLQHTNIVNVIDFDKIRNSDALIMEFVNGVDALRLFQICKKLKMNVSVGMAAFIGSELARGLHYAHTRRDIVSGKELGIVHCDVSPSNILISYEGEVKLTDFGVARSNAETSDLTAGAVKGKIRYMSPEYLHSGKADPRLDIYSLGVSIWELLAGQELFRGNTKEEISKMKVDGLTNIKLRDYNDSVDEGLEEILQKCLFYDPVKRYKNAQELERDLTRYFHLRDPGFTPMKLGKFLQSVRTKEYKEMQETIRAAYAKTRARPVKNSAGSDKNQFSQDQDTLVVTPPVPTDSKPKKEAAAPPAPPAPPSVPKASDAPEAPPPPAASKKASADEPKKDPTQLTIQPDSNLKDAVKETQEAKTTNQPISDGYISTNLIAPVDYGDWQRTSWLKRAVVALVLLGAGFGCYKFLQSESKLAAKINQELPFLKNIIKN